MYGGLVLFFSSWIFGAGCASDSGADAACDSATCESDERCIQGACSAPCGAQRDCEVGRNCALWGFGDGSQGSFCVTLPYAADGRTGQFEPCASDDECDTLRGFQCFSAECRPRCRSHFDCAGVGHCTTFVDDGGARGQFCRRDPEPPARGRFHTNCPNGDECDAQAGFMCIGAGVGDLDAYCTRDCASDDDCEKGYFCSKIVRGPPCANECGFRGDPDNPSCIPSDQIGPGNLYECGVLGLDRRVCRSREFCTPCGDDADCLALPSQVCADDGGGTKICTQTCDLTVGSCPWGNAALCGVFDDALGIATCAHRSGSCKGQGRGCDPCVADEDCGAGNFCTSSSFTGERWCVDRTVSCACATQPASGICTGGGCPVTASGLAMFCIDNPDSALSNICYGANTAANPIVSSPQTGCWAAL